MKGSRVQVSDSALKKGNGSICYRFSFYNSGAARTRAPPKSPFSKGGFRRSKKTGTPSGIPAENYELLMVGFWFYGLIELFLRGALHHKSYGDGEFYADLFAILLACGPLAG